MSQVEFDNENNFEFKSREIFGDYKKPGISDWLEKKGIVKDEASAKYLLIWVIVICFTLTGLIIFRDDILNYFNLNNSKDNKFSESELQRLPPEVIDNIKFYQDVK